MAAMRRHTIYEQANNRLMIVNPDKGRWHRGRTRGRWRGAARGRGVAWRAGGVWHVTDAHRGRVVLTTGDRHTSTVLDTCKPLIKQAVNEDRSHQN